MTRHAAHRRLAEPAVFLGFGGGTSQAWQRLLAPGFRHCFAGLRDADGWTVVDPLSGRLHVTRLGVGPEYDLAALWTRAGFAVLGPFAPSEAVAMPLPGLLPLTCVSVCRALLGPGAPFALTPRGLFSALEFYDQKPRKKSLTNRPA